MALTDNHASHTPARPRILIVEDDPFVALDMETTLLDAGYDVVGVVASGERALDLAARLRPDLAIMDIGLTGPMDGIDAATELRRQLDIPSVFATGTAEAAARGRSAAAAPAGYIEKPFRMAELTTLVASALRRS